MLLIRCCKFKTIPIESMKVLLLALILLAGQTYAAHAQTDTIVVSGLIDMKDIDKSNKMIELLSSKNKRDKQAAADVLLAHPNDYNPAVTYVLSSLLLEQNKKREAMFWFYLSQVRARVDATICKDNSAKQIVSVLNKTYGPPINKVAF